MPKYFVETQVEKIDIQKVLNIKNVNIRREVIRKIGIERILSKVDYSSYDSAIEILNKIVEALDAQLLKLGNDTVNADCAVYSISTSHSLFITPWNQ